MVAPQASRTVVISSSTGTSLGSMFQTRASVSACPSESSSSGVCTRESSAYSARRGVRTAPREMACVSRRYQRAKSARRGSKPVRASSAESGSRYSGACQTARSRPNSQRRTRPSMPAITPACYLPPRAMAFDLLRPRGRLETTAVIAGAAALLAAALVSAGDVRVFPGEDLRPKVLGARALIEGLDPYTYEQGPGTPEALLDYTRQAAHLTRVTYTPAVLCLYAP